MSLHCYNSVWEIIASCIVPHPPQELCHAGRPAHFYPSLRTFLLVHSPGLVIRWPIFVLSFGFILARLVIGRQNPLHPRLLMSTGRCALWLIPVLGLSLLWSRDGGLEWCSCSRYLFSLGITLWGISPGLQQQQTYLKAPLFPGNQFNIKSNPDQSIQTVGGFVILNIEKIVQIRMRRLVTSRHI